MDLLEGGGIGQRTGRAFGLAPGDVVEVVVLERPVQVVGVAEAVVAFGVEHVVPVAVAAGVARDVVVDVGRSSLPGLNAAEVVVVQQRVNHLVVVDDQPAERPIGDGAARLAAEHVDARGVAAVQHVAGHLQRLRIADRHRLSLPEAARAKPDVFELVAHDAHAVEAPHGGQHNAPVGSVGDLDRSVVGAVKHVVGYDHVIDGIMPALCLQEHTLVDVLEAAVAHPDVPTGAQEAHAARFHIPALVAHPPGRGRQGPVDVGETEREPADVDVAHALALDHVDALRRLHAGRVRVAVAGQADVEPAALPLLVEPKLARLIQVVRLVLQVVAAAADDLIGDPAPLAAKRQRPLLPVHHAHLCREGASHHPALGAPEEGVFVVLGRLGLVDVLLVKGQVPSAAVDLHVVVEGPVRVLPRPPLALDVVLVGDLPVRRPRQLDADDGAVRLHHPDVARGEVQVGIPDLLGLRDVRMAGLLLPAADHLRAADDGFAHPPVGIARQPDRIAGPARLIGDQLPAIGHAPFEDIRMDALARGGVALCLAIPWMMLPR